MIQEIEKRLFKEPLREIEPDTIFDFLERHWGKISVDIVPFGQKKIVPNGWHGEGTSYEAMVYFGDVLTRETAGTNLSANSFTHWLADKGFLFEQDTRWLSPSEAAQVLSSEATQINGAPTFRAWRREKGTVPIQLEFNEGAMSPKMQKLSLLGNLRLLTNEQKHQYSDVVAGLLASIVATGTTKVRDHMGLEGVYRRQRQIDDCVAVGTTFVGKKLITLEMKRSDEPLFWVDDSTVATTQSAVIAIFMAEKYGVPLLMRAGAPAFGLGGEADGLCYIMNTQELMLRYGIYTAGDFGDNMVKRGKTQWQPALLHYGHGSSLRETTFFLRGGGPLMDMMFEALSEKNKKHQGIISVVIAKRVDDGPDKWGVVFDGVHAAREDEYFPQYFVEPGTILRYGPNSDAEHEELGAAGIYAQLLGESDGWRKLRVRFGERMLVLYEPLPTS